MTQLAAVAALACLLLAGPARAQETPTPPAARDTAADTLRASLPSPRSAFLRSLLVPGWGQVTFGAYKRAAVFVSAQTASALMLYKTSRKLGRARDTEERLVGLARDSLFDLATRDTAIARRIADPIALDSLIALDRNVSGTRDLVSSREEQREDWIAWLAFWTLASAVDAYVVAHLADFPADVAVEPGRSGGLEIGVTLRPGRWR